MLRTTFRLLIGLSFLFTLPALAADHGLFMVVKGSVKVISGKDKKENLAKVGSKVFSGDTVITEKDSRAKIVMADRNVLQLSPDSKLEITNYKTGATENDRQVQLALNNGKVRVEVEQKYGEKNKFELRTPTAVAGVRGTKYVAQFNQATATSSFMVLSGTVVVGSTRGGPPVTLTANMTSTVGNNAPPTEARKMSNQEKQEAQGESSSGSGATSSGGASSGGASGGSSTESGGSGSSSGSGSTTKSENSMVTSELKGPEVKQDAPSSIPAAAPVNVPPVVAAPPTVPKPPIPPAIVNDIIQNKNNKTKVIVTPKPQ